MSPKGVYEPDAIVVKTKNSQLEGVLEKNSMTYELSPSDDGYEVSVKGQDKLKETVYVSQVSDKE